MKIGGERGKSGRKRRRSGDEEDTVTSKVFKNPKLALKSSFLMDFENLSKSRTIRIESSTHWTPSSVRRCQINQKNPSEDKKPS